MKKYDSYIFPRTWWLMLCGVDSTTRDETLCAINEYAFDGIEPQGLSPLAQGLFIAMRAALDNSKEKFDEIRKKRSEAGKRGNEIRWAEKSEDVANIANATENRKCDTVSQKSQTSQTSPNDSLLDNNSTLFFPSLDACARGNERKKEEFLIEITKEMLRRGSKEPKKEAEAYWAYNSEKGWRKGNGRAINDPVAWASKWQCGLGVDAGISRYAREFLLMCDALGFSNNIDILDGFDHIEWDGSTVNLFFKSQYACKTFRAKENDDEALDNLKGVFSIYFPNSRLNYKTRK